MKGNLSIAYFNRREHVAAVMLSFIILFASLALSTADFLYAGKDCTVTIDYKHGDLQEFQPLVLTTDTWQPEFLYPRNQTRTLRLPAGQSIYLACPGKNNYLRDLGKLQETKATCVRDKIFSIDGVPRDFSSLTCFYLPRHDAYRTGPKCLGRYSTVEIGFQLNNSFLKTIEVCRDDETFHTFYTKCTMTKAINHYQTGYPRPSKWLTGDYYENVNVDAAYKFDNQLKTIAKLVNSTAIANTRLRKSVQFLSRGHMTAKADFVYGSQQRTTFWYMNAAPQWQSFNGGNWNSLEDSVRRFAATRKQDLEVYTGVHGQMTMADANGKQQPIHLYVNSQRRALAAPRFYWKIIYDPSSMRATVFVGLNDPFIERITQDVFLCEDISYRINWLTWQPNDIVQGVSYACTYHDFRQVVPNIPDLQVVDVLI